MDNLQALPVQLADAQAEIQHLAQEGGQKDLEIQQLRERLAAFEETGD